MRTVSTVYQTASGFVSSPNPVAAKAGSYLLSPTTQFANSYQDFNKSTGLRVWYSEATGAHSAAGHTAKVWVPELGLATTDESGGPTGTYTTFEYGKITWNPLTGAKIVWADGHGPGTTPTSTTIATTTTTATTIPTTTPVTTTPPVTTVPPTTTPKPVSNPLTGLLTLLSNLLGSLGGR